MGFRPTPADPVTKDRPRARLKPGGHLFFCRAGGSAHEPKVPQQDMQGADGYRQGYDDLVGQWPFLHQKVSVRLPVRRNLEAIRAGDARKAPPERGLSARHGGTLNARC